MSYALITGASKGIGKAIAEELAKRKIDVLLIARSRDLLEKISNHLTQKYGVKANYFSIDLSETNAAKKIFDWCISNNYSVNILINNAAYGLCGLIEKYQLEEHVDMMHVNVTIPLQLSYLFLPQLSQQSNAYIMNVSSCACYQAVPGLNIYSASKAFILNFSRGLRYELKNTNVSVTVVSPGATDTDFLIRANIDSAQAKRIAKIFNMSPQKVAAIAVKGMFAKKAEVITGFINQLNTFLVWLLPKSWVEKSAARIYDVR